MLGATRGVLGDPGTCKTLFLTYVGYESYLAGEKIVSNYSLEFPHIKIRFDQLGYYSERAEDACKIQPGQICDHGFPPLLENAVILIDEMGRGADSYEFLSTQNKEITKLIFQIRKLGALMYYSAQRYLTVTTRVRHLTNMFFLMDTVEADRQYALENPHLIGNELSYPMQKLVNGKVIIKGLAKVEITNEHMETVRKFRFDGRRYFNLYNTREMVW